jgi:hypothetical protein
MKQQIALVLAQMDKGALNDANAEATERAI